VQHCRVPSGRSPVSAILNIIRSLADLSLRGRKVSMKRCGSFSRGHAGPLQKAIKLDDTATTRDSKSWLGASVFRSE
jgi:hypothetical protein